MKAAGVTALAPLLVGGRRRRTNVLLVLVDDIPPAALPAMRSCAERLLALGGTDLTPKGYGDIAVCGPARVGLFTGRYAHNHGATNNDVSYALYRKRGYAASDLFARAKAAGYRTGMFGKYLNGYGVDDPGKWVHQAVDRWVALVGEQGDRSPYPVNIDGSLREKSQNHTPFFGGHAENFIRNSARTPWLCYLALTDPHAPHTPVAADEHDYNGAAYSSPGVEETDLSDKSGWARNIDDGPSGGSGSTPADWQKNWEGTLEEVEGIERWFNRLLSALEETGQMQNTAIFFTSDNGYMHGEHGGLFKKQLPYEESLRVPFLVRLPGARVPDGTLVLRLDLTATILEYAEGPSFDDSAVDGRSLLAAAREEAWRSRLLAELPDVGWTFLREGDTAYIRLPTEEEEMYDLSVDPYELDNLLHDPTPEARAKAAELSGRLETLKAATGEELRAAETV